DQRLMCGRVRQRALRGEPVGLRARGRRAAVAAGRIRARGRELPVVAAVIDEDPVAGKLVRLDEDDTAVAVAGARKRVLSPDEHGGENGEQDRQRCSMLHLSSSALTAATLGTGRRRHPYDLRNVSRGAPFSLHLCGKRIKELVTSTRANRR